MKEWVGIVLLLPGAVLAWWHFLDAMIAPERHPEYAGLRWLDWIPAVVVLVFTVAVWWLFDEGED